MVEIIPISRYEWVIRILTEKRQVWPSKLKLVQALQLVLSRWRCLFWTWLAVATTRSASESEAEKIDILGMVISVFHLPNMGGEKITLSISVLLALTFFLNLVSGLTPRNGVFSLDYLVLTLKSLAWRFTCSIKEHELWFMCYEMHENLKFIKPD